MVKDDGDIRVGVLWTCFCFSVLFWALRESGFDGL